MIMARVKLADEEMDHRAERKYVFNAEEGECSLRDQFTQYTSS